MRVGIVDYGVGNVGSVLRTLDLLGAKPLLISEPNALASVDKLILPGVGNFADCRRLLDAGGWTGPILEAVQALGRPLLGICVGMQLLADTSTEGTDNGTPVPGLGLIPGKVEHIRILGCTGRTPHVGWNAITPLGDDNQMLAGIPIGTDFYFVHSYAMQPNERSHISATVSYGVDLTAAVRRGHVWGTQFHPEKSSLAGFRIFRNFIETTSC